MKCEICGRDRALNEGTTVVLTEEDRAFVAHAMGAVAPASYFYCNPCYRVVTDREKGARLIASQLEMQLRAAGNPNAAKVAERVYKFLIEKSKATRVS